MPKKTDITPAEAALRERIAAILDAHNAKLRDQRRMLWFLGKDADLEHQLENVIRAYEEAAIRSVTSAKAFRDDVLTFIRAWSMIADMAANASTHQEKNARLRGMIELLETAAKKLHEMSFDAADDWWRYEDVFRSDYPTLHYVRRIHELEDEIKRLKGTPHDG